MVLTFDIDTLLISIFDNIVSNQEIRHLYHCDPISPKCFIFEVHDRWLIWGGYYKEQFETCFVKNG